MQLKLDLDSSENIVSLNRIIDMVLGNAEMQKYQPQFEYMKVYEQKFMDQIKQYSHSIRKHEFDNFSEQQLEEAAESQSLALHEVMSDACIEHLRHGMKLGAALVLELLH